MIKMRDRSATQGEDVSLSVAEKTRLSPTLLFSIFSAIVEAWTDRRLGPRWNERVLWAWSLPDLRYDVQAGRWDTCGDRVQAVGTLHTSAPCGPAGSTS